MPFLPIDDLLVQKGYFVLQLWDLFGWTTLSLLQMIRQDVAVMGLKSTHKSLEIIFVADGVFERRHFLSQRFQLAFDLLEV